MIELFAPFEDAAGLQKLRAGDTALLTGGLLTGRDAAHKRLFELLERGGQLPVPLKNQCIYYTGPCPAAPGEVIGPCGPTTSGRMDKYTPLLLENGLKGMIGKGERNDEVTAAIARYGAVYFGVTGGAALFIQSFVKECRTLAFEELGTEAIYELKVEKVPLLVLCDSLGKTLRSVY